MLKVDETVSLTLSLFVLLRARSPAHAHLRAAAVAWRFAFGAKLAKVFSLVHGCASPLRSVKAMGTSFGDGMTVGPNRRSLLRESVTEFGDVWRACLPQRVFRLVQLCPSPMPNGRAAYDN